MSYFLGTFLFLLLEAGFYVFVNWFFRPHERQLPHLLFASSVFCCWMMWGIIYMAQMNPLVLPVMNEA